jgi:multiple sugar transport system permease protein
MSSTKTSRYQAAMGYVFITPTMLLFVVFTIIPIFIALYLSFTQYDVLQSPVWIGFGNYALMIKDRLFRISVGNVFYFAVLSVPLNTILALLLASLLNMKFRGTQLFRVLFYMPAVTSGVVAATVWLFLLNPDYGIVNQFLGFFGIQGPAWLANSDTAMISIVIVALWQGLGGNMIIFLAGLQGVPSYLYESAKLDGAGPWALFRYVTLPSLKPAMFFVTTLNIIGALQLFDQAYVLTQGGPGYATMSVVYNIYQSGFSELHMGYASAQAFILAIMILVFSWVNARLNKEGSMI